MLEALIVVVVLATALAGAALPASTNLLGAGPTSYAIGRLLGRGRLDREPRPDAPGLGRRGAGEHTRQAARTAADAGGQRHPYRGTSTATVVAIFVAGALVTLAAGVLLQESGNVLADRMGVQGAVFGATFLAAATALPEISSGIAAVRLGDMQLAVGDILGGNSFQITLFLLADLLAGTPVIVAVHHSDVWLGGLGLLMTAVVASAVIARPRRTFLRLGIDSIALIAIYAGGVALLTKVVG